MSDSAEIDYAGLVEQALLGLVREVLERVAREGPPGEHHFYLTFRTAADGVELPAFLRQKYPQEMTIVLQHQYSGLEVDAAGFGVTLRFGGAPARLRVPFAALSAFVDPHASFGLRFGPQQETATEAAEAEPLAEPGAAAEPAPSAEAAAETAERPSAANVVAFRRPRQS